MEDNGENSKISQNIHKNSGVGDFLKTRQSLINKKINNGNFILTLLSLIIVLSAVRLFFISQNIWPINGDEAQYWGWSQHLAFGYYSKPPLLAWLIALFTFIFGDNAVGLRMASVLCHGMTSVVIYLIGTRLYQARVGFWAALIYLTAPGVVFASTIISTDAPLLLFWALALYSFILAIQTQSVGLRYWVGCGFFLGLAFLSKYAAIFFVISLGLYLIISKEDRIQGLKLGLYVAFLVLFFILLPNIIWNYQHHFVSLSEIKANANLALSSWVHFDHLLEFIGAQFGIFNPIFFIIFLIMLLIGLWVRPDKSQILLLTFVWPIFFSMCTEAFLSRAHANWAAPMYVALSVAVAAFLINRQKIMWLWLGLIINLIVQAGFFAIQPLIRVSGISMTPASSTLNWPGAGKIIKHYQNQYPNSLILVDNRMLLAQILYFSRTPLQKMVKWNPTHVIRDHYDMVTSMPTISTLQEQDAKNFILISYRHYPIDIFKHFESVINLTPLQLPTLDGKGVMLYFFYLKNFRGY